MKSAQERGLLSRREFGASLAAVIATLLLPGEDTTVRQWSTTPTLEANGRHYLLIADPHAGPYNRDRLVCTQVLETLKEVLFNLRGLPFEYVIQLGDLIQEDTSLETNLQYYSACLDLFEQFPVPTLHLLGNHDLWGIFFETMSALFQSRKSNFLGSGVLQLPDLQLALLNPVAQKGTLSYAHEEDIVRLKENLDPHQRTLFLSHYSLRSHPKNPLFTSEIKTALTNGEEVLRMLRDYRISLMIHGHTHKTQLRDVENIPEFTVPSFTQNWQDSWWPQCPGAYAIMSVIDKEVVLRVFKKETQLGQPLHLAA